jgi:PAS domain S-box-containing protein
MNSRELTEALVRDTIEAVAYALKGEVVIIDRKLNFIGGTEKGRSLAAAGQKKTLLESGLRRLGDLSSAIVVEDQIIGWIACFLDQVKDQKEFLQARNFLDNYASILSHVVKEKQSSARFEGFRNILESIHEGVLAVNHAGEIYYCNENAEDLLKSSADDLINANLLDLWPESPAIKAIEKNLEYTEKEEIYHVGGKWMHFIVSLRLISGLEGNKGAVISFRDIAEARRLIYDLSQNSPGFTFKDIVGRSEIIKNIKEQALRVAKSNSTVLITGESGTGKEVFARAIHYASLRSRGPFINLNCGAIPENLLESELFGYEGGAFTGALKEGKAGKFELADGGTIFLDEIGEMPLHLQVKLLHVLQNREVERVGGTKKIPVDVRIIAASNRDLDKMMQERKFRKDLYFRLGVIPLYIAPLRDRKEDIPLLVNYFIENLARKMNRPNLSVSQEIIDKFLGYHWPGNIRELENALEYAVNMCPGQVLTPAYIPPGINKPKQEYEETGKSLKTLLHNCERQVIEEYLHRFGSSSNEKNQVARVLGISRATLYRRIAELDIKSD